MPAGHSQVDEGVVRLHLPALRRARIDSFSIQTRGKLRLDRDSFRAARQLERLSLDTHEAVTLLPECLAGLTALAAVNLTGCGLVRIPEALTAVSAGLSSMALPYNDELQLANSDVATLLPLRRLRHLDLRKTPFDEAIDYGLASAVLGELHYEPPLWSMRSLQRLVSFLSAFFALHGHAVDLLMDENIEEEADQDSESGQEDGVEADDDACGAGDIDVQTSRVQDPAGVLCRAYLGRT